MKFLCIGNTNYDITLLTNNYPEENKKIKLANKVIECSGGSASNSSYLLSNWGIDTTLASIIGNDFYGKRIKEEYDKTNINTKYLEIQNIKTPISYIIVNQKNGSRTILIDRDDNIKFNNINEITDFYDYILVDGGQFELAYKTIINNPKSISIVDAGKLNDNILSLCKICNYVICSNDFAKDYTNINFDYQDINTIKKVYDIIQKDFNGLLIITLEKYGSFVKIDNKYHLIPSIKVKPIDSTAAGDLYHASFAYFISQGYSITEAMKYANITGALSTTKIGGKNSIPKLSEVKSYE